MMNQGAANTGQSRQIMFMKEINWVDENLSKGFSYDPSLMAEKFSFLTTNLGAPQSQEAAANLASLRVVTLKLIARIFGEFATGFDGMEHLQTQFLKQHLQLLKASGAQNTYEWCTSSQAGGWLRYLISDRNRDVAEASTSSSGGNASSLNNGMGTQRSSGSAVAGSTLTDLNDTASALKAKASEAFNRIAVALGVERNFGIRPDAAKLLTLLYPGSDLMLLFERDFSRQGFFEMKVSRFPPKFKWILRRTYQSNMDFYDCVRTPNQVVYSLLTCGTRLASVGGGMLGKGGGGGGGGGGGAGTGEGSAEKVLLHPVEYFMVTLFNYPTSGSSADDLFHVYSNTSTYQPLPGANAPKPPEVINLLAVSLMQQSGAFHWLRGNPYLVLLNQYIHEFSYYTEPPPGKNYGAAVFPNGAQIFIRLAVEFWLENTTVMKRDFHHEAINRAMLCENQYLVERERYKLAHAQTTAKGITHPLPDEVKMLNEDSWRCPFPCLQSFHLLLIHLLNRPTLAHDFQAFSEASFTTGRGGFGGSRMGYSHREVELLACPMPLNIVQLPLFDTLRVILTRHYSNCATFSLAVETWLLYIQPWKVGPHMLTLNTHIPASAAYSGRGNSEFTPVWRAYVACNLHFYTTILVCFLKAMSKVQFDSSYEGKMYFLLLNKVLHVFNERTLKKTISSLNSHFSMYPFANVLTNGTPTSSPRTMGSGGGGSDDIPTEYELCVMRNQHRVLFPDDSIHALTLQGCNAGIITPPRYKNAMYAAGKIIYSLEYIMAQRTSKLSLSGGGGDILGFLLGSVSTPIRSEGGPSQEEINHTVTALCHLMRDNEKETNEDVKSRLRATLEASDLAEIGSSGSADMMGGGHQTLKKKSHDHANGNGKLERNVVGVLSNTSRLQLSSGRVKCEIDEGSIAYIDPLSESTPIRSYEVEQMARFFINLSIKLNHRLGLPRKPGSEVGNFKRIARTWINDIVITSETREKLYALRDRFPLLDPIAYIVCLMLVHPRLLGTKLTDRFRLNLRPLASYYVIIPTVIACLYFYHQPSHFRLFLNLCHNMSLYLGYFYESVLMSFTNISFDMAVELNVYFFLHVFAICGVISPHIFYAVCILVLSLRCMPERRGKIVESIQKLTGAVQEVIGPLVNKTFPPTPHTNSQ